MNKKIKEYDSIAGLKRLPYKHKFIWLKISNEPNHDVYNYIHKMHENCVSTWINYVLTVNINKGGIELKKFTKNENRKFFTKGKKIKLQRIAISEDLYNVLRKFDINQKSEIFNYVMWYYMTYNI